MAWFLKFVYKALQHSNSTINHITKHACGNPMYVCGRNWHAIVCKNGMSAQEIYN